MRGETAAADGTPRSSVRARVQGGVDASRVVALVGCVRRGGCRAGGRGGRVRILCPGGRQAHPDHQWAPHLTGQVLQQIGGPVLAPNGTALFSFRAVQVGRARLVMDDLAGASASSPRSWWIGVNVGTLTLKPSEFVPHPAPSH